MPLTGYSLRLSIDNVAGNTAVFEYIRLSGVNPTVFGQRAALGYEISFENTLTKPVLLEIKAGTNANCDLNEQIYDQLLNGGDSKTINTDQPVVCYRRTKDPDNPGDMTAWETFSPDDSNTPANIDLGLVL